MKILTRLLDFLTRKEMAELNATLDCLDNALADNLKAWDNLKKP